MQMIDRLTDADERTARGSFCIREDNPFAHKGYLGESALIEFIAQTAAAFTGYRNAVNDTGVNEGYIGAVKNLSINELPRIGTEIQSEIEVVNEIVGFTIIIGKVFFENRLIAECEMRILQAPGS